MAHTPHEGEYQYDEPIPEPVGVELNRSDDDLSEGFDSSKEIKIENGTELKRLLSTFGDEIDISERIDFEYDKKRLVIDANRGMELERPEDIKTFLRGVNEVLFGADLIPERTYEVNNLTMDKAAFTSLHIDGYEDHKKVERWETHEEIDNPEEFNTYLNALAQRIHAASGVPDGAWHPAVMDIIEIGKSVKDGEITLEEGKSRMRQIDASEALRAP